MTEQAPVYKAVIRSPIDAATRSLIKQWKAIQMSQVSVSIGGKVATMTGKPLACLQSSFLDDIFEIAERHARSNAMADAAKYLNAINRVDHFINTYASIDRDTQEVTITHVVSNRDTALMLKLALA